MKKTLLAAIVATAIAPSVNAIEIYKDDKNAVTIGGWVDIRAIDTQDVSEVANGASRINFGFNRELKNGWSAFAKLEWGVNPVGSSKVIYKGDNGFNQSQDDFMYNRLGYAGLSHGDLGSITIGKQWGAYYDAVWYTNLVYFGDGNGSGTYTYNKFDGAINGTGRGDKTIQYRNSFGALDLAVQIQLKQDTFIVDTSNAANQGVFFSKESVKEIEYNNTFGLGLTYHLNPELLVTFGANLGELEFTNENGTKFEETDYIYTLGFAYGNWGQPGYYAAANANVNEYHDTDNLGRMIPESFGGEALFAYQYDNGVRFMLSYNLLDAGDKYQELYQGDVFKRQSMVFGTHYVFDANTVVFAEFSKDLGDYKGQNEAAMKLSEDDALLFGIRYSL